MSLQENILAVTINTITCPSILVLTNNKKCSLTGYC
jgi:hypothetical protein